MRTVSFLLLLQLPYSVFPGTEFMDNVIVLPKTKRYRINSGSSISLNCNKAKDDVAWEFKPCEMNYKGMNCVSERESTIQGVPWKSLDELKGKKLIKIENASLLHVGIYRCISGNLIRKIFIVEINAITFVWPPPKVISVIPNKNVINLNDHLTINCSVSSRTPPEILWFKVCWTNKCELDFAAYDIEFQENYNCLCLIHNTRDSTYNWDNLYVSKLHIFNTRVWDGGTYICSALSSDGKDYKNVTVHVEFQHLNTYSNPNLYTTLLLIPVIFILLYITSYVFCVRSRKEYQNNDHLHYLKCTNQVIK